jgi:hypothetical protein
MAFYAICGFLALVWFLLVLGHWRAALAVIGAPIFIGLCIYAVFLVEAASRGQVWTVLPGWLESTSETLKAKPGMFDDLIPAQEPGGALRKSDALKPLHKPERDRLPR